MTDYSNDLIFGKDKTCNIVSLEADGETVTIFQQQPNGTVTTRTEDNVYWLLTAIKVDNSYVQLQGNLHYQYAKTFRDKLTMYKARAYLKSKGIDHYSVSDPKEAIMLRNGYTYFKGMSVKDVSILSFDIETTGLKHNEDSKILLISATYRDCKGGVKNLYCYDQFNSQGKMLEAFCKDVRELDPSIILGHNILSFDLPYMKYIADKEGVKLELGRDGSPLKFDSWESNYRKDGSQSIAYHKAHVYGRNVIDTLFLSIKFDATERKFESYGLKNIIKQMKMEKEDRVFYDASLIRKNYTIPDEWEKIKAYCADDSDDSLKLFDKFSPPFFYMTTRIPKSFQAVIESATGSQINSLICRGYLQRKHSIPKASEITSFRGGLSMGLPGVYRNAWKLDIKSCYPSAILINELYSKEKDPERYMLELCRIFTKERLEYKELFESTGDSKYDHLNSSAKIFINSLFGFCGAPGLNFNDGEVAAEITRYGREYLNIGLEWATGKNDSYWKDTIEKAKEEIDV